MPKIIEYPRAPFARVMEMATAIDYLGGNCSFQSCADRMGVKVTGAFTALVGAAKKHEIVDSKKEVLYVSELFKKIKLAYDDDEKRLNIRSAFLSPPLYRKIYDKFKGKELPIDMLSRLLIREYGVEEEMASRLAGYFVEGARSCEILIDNKLIDVDGSSDSGNGSMEKKNEVANNPVDLKPKEENNNDLQKAHTPVMSVNDETYVIHIQGPGINSKLAVAEPEDFIILEAMISKLKKKMKSD